MGYVLNEVKGYLQGETIIVVNCDSALDAIKRAGKSEYIKPYERFKTITAQKIYEVYEIGKPYKVEYICR